MYKIAFFVEGQTEMLFLEKLLAEIFGQKKIAVETQRTKGGKSCAKTVVKIKSPTIDGSTKYYALISDCGSDSRVASEVADNRESMIKAGFSKIIGIRDVFPRTIEELPEVRKYLYHRIPQKDIAIRHILGIMEIESWFLAEHTHFEKIDPALSVNLIEKNLGFNPEADNMELRANPAKDLTNCYRLVSKTYNKKERNAKRTIELLDYSLLYFVLPMKVSSLSELISEIEEMFVVN